MRNGFIEDPLIGTVHKNIRGDADCASNYLYDHEYLNAPEMAQCDLGKSFQS